MAMLALLLLAGAVLAAQPGHRLVVENLIIRDRQEFLLGEDLLVAPVLEEGATRRDVYLPHGEWRDMNDGKLVAGPALLADYSAPLDTLPWFVRAGSDSDK